MGQMFHAGVLAAYLAVARADIAPTLAGLRFFHAGATTAGRNFTRQEQCSGFSECYAQWTCGNPRDYLWDTSAGAGIGDVRAPPMGLRSAVPLGGLGAGTFELRGDGTFADWMVDGQGTALAANVAQNSKVPLKGEAFLGLYASASTGGGAQTFAAALRTAPLPGVPGVAGLTYSGAHPVSRLRVDDARAPFNATLFAYSALLPGRDAVDTSGLPVVYFSLLLAAPASATGPVDASLLLSLPLSSSADTDRPLVGGGDARGQLIATLTGGDAAACRSACDARAGCTWWRHSGPGSPNATLPDTDCPGADIMTPPRVAVPTLADCVEQCLSHVPGCTALVFDTIASEQGSQCGNADPARYCCLPKSACGATNAKAGDVTWVAGRPGAVCSLYDRAPAVEQFLSGSGARSGVAGMWSSGAPVPGLRALTLRRRGPYDADAGAAFQDPPAATGSYTLLAADADADVTFAAADDVAGGVWPAFAATGRLPSAAVAGVGAAHGAIAARVTLAPGQTRTITLVFAWHLPHRMYVGQELGNAYAAAFNDSAAVAAAAAARLEPDVAPALAAWNGLWADATLPDWFADFMVNSLAPLTKLSVWVARDVNLQPTPGGRFRQFEAYSGCDLAPVHVLAYSMLPYVLLFPALLKNELRTGWAARQAADGMILEFLGDFSAPGGRLTGPMDTSAGGRTMGDVTSVFILATLGVVRSTGDDAFAAGMWPAVARAARWQIARAAAHGCPDHLQTTYDYLGLDAHVLATYNAFLHNAAMRAAATLGVRVGDNSTLAADAEASEARCLAAVSRDLWRGNGTAGRGWWRAWSDASGGGGTTDTILSGALHGQSWASALGLGLLAPAANVTAHGAAEAALNCAYVTPPTPGGAGGGGCALGLLTLRAPGAQWGEDASPAQSWDATAARLIAGGGGLDGSPAEAVVRLYRDVHADMWHWMDLHAGPAGLGGCGGGALSGPGLAGQPFVNSHYARQVQAWAALLAFTGQAHDAGAGGTLALRPTCEAAAAAERGVRVPFLTPHATGTVTVTWRGGAARASVRVRSGRLEVAALTVRLDRCAHLLPSGAPAAFAAAASVAVGAGGEDVVLVPVAGEPA